jgi:8-oxo-dGTP pyrophosphatase MutT (NUDIX family)
MKKMKNLFSQIINNNLKRRVFECGGVKFNFSENKNMEHYNYNPIYNDRFIKLKNVLINNSKINIYRGAEVNLDDILTDNKEEILQHFENLLKHSLQEWDKKGIRSIRVNVPIKHSEFIKLFVDQGFYFHHTHLNSLQLCKWTDKTIENKIPVFAHHNIGVAAVIMNKNLEFLLVQEKYSRDNKRLWKFVTGLTELGENIEQGCLREAKEEVGLDIDFRGCLVISEIFPNQHKVSDLCFFNLCTLKDEERKIEIDNHELFDARYFDLETIKDMMEKNEVTKFTIFVFRKLFSLLDNNISKEENYKKLLEKNNRIFQHNKQEETMIFNYVNTLS